MEGGIRCARVVRANLKSGGRSGETCCTGRSWDRRDAPRSSHADRRLGPREEIRRHPPAAAQNDEDDEDDQRNLQPFPLFLLSWWWGWGGKEGRRLAAWIGRGRAKPALRLTARIWLAAWIGRRWRRRGRVAALWLAAWIGALILGIEGACNSGRAAYRPLLGVIIRWRCLAVVAASASVSAAVRVWGRLRAVGAGSHLCGRKWISRIRAGIGAWRSGEGQATVLAGGCAWSHGVLTSWAALIRWWI